MPGFSVEITRACADQAKRLSRIAHDAKRHWGYSEHWLESWHDVLTVRPAQVETHDYFAASVDGEVVGFYGLHGAEADGRLEHLWIMPAHWNRGLGRRLFGDAVERTRQGKMRGFAIQSDPHAEGFYLRMGAARVGSVNADMDGIRRVLPELYYALH